MCTLTVALKKFEKKTKQQQKYSCNIFAHTNTNTRPHNATIVERVEYATNFYLGLSCGPKLDLMRVLNIFLCIKIIN